MAQKELKQLQQQSQQQGNQAGIFVPKVTDTIYDKMTRRVEPNKKQDKKSWQMNHYICATDGSIKEDPKSVLGVSVFKLSGNIKSIHVTTSFYGHEAQYLPEDWAQFAYKDKDDKYIGYKNIGFPTEQGTYTFDLIPPENAAYLLVTSNWIDNTEVYADIIYPIDIAQIAKDVNTLAYLAYLAPPKSPMQLTFSPNGSLLIEVGTLAFNPRLKQQYIFTKNIDTFNFKLEVIDSKSGDIIKGYRAMTPSLNSSDFGPIFGPQAYSLPALTYIPEGLQDKYADGAIVTSDEGYKFKVIKPKVTTTETGSIVAILIPQEGDKNWMLPSTFAFSDIGGYKSVVDYNLSKCTDLRVEINNGFPIEVPSEEEGPQVYNIRECKVIITRKEYDPSTIEWSAAGPAFEFAEPIAQITDSYTFKDSACYVNSAITFLKDISTRFYAGVNLRLIANGWSSSIAMQIPKLKIGSLDFNSPVFRSKFPSAQYIYRNSSFLPDVTKVPDRLMIRGFMNQVNNQTSDLIAPGIAIGQSLISGCTAKNKILSSLPEYTGSDTKNSIGLVGKIGLQGAYHIFSLAAFSGAKFEGNMIPAGTFQEVNYYLTCYNPAGPNGDYKNQDYWYKDGNSYVIYLHCQKQHDLYEAELPSYMEGLALEVIEKTDGAELLVDRIIGNKIRVKYSDAANYIVIKAS